MSCDPTRPERETCEEIPVETKKGSLNSLIFINFLNRLVVSSQQRHLLLHYHHRVKQYVHKVLLVIMELTYVL